ncbi:18158_t:CDS:2 [Entrophospora sp. SA101]|nr:18158_t:CDS:2 [Entrophospora sp. SA101]
MISQTIEILVGLEKKKLNKSDFDKKLCEQFMQNVVKLKEEPSGWIIKIGKNEYDFVKIICNSLININAMILDFDDPILSYWGSSTASKYRKDQLSKLEKEYRNKENVNPFSISNVGNKPDLWVETKIAGRLHEIIFSETSGSPFNDTSSDEKIKYDRKKLIRFARDTFTKMCNELIENKISYLPNYKEIYKAISNIQIFLLQSCGKRMKIYIVDFPSNSFGRVREYCDLEVPYKSISEIELQRFIGTLFRIRVHMESNIKLIRKISTELSKNFNGIPGRGPSRTDIRKYYSHPSPPHNN